MSKNRLIIFRCKIYVSYKEVVFGMKEKVIVTSRKRRVYQSDGPIQSYVHQVRDNWLKREFVRSASPIWTYSKKKKKGFTNMESN